MPKVQVKSIKGEVVGDIELQDDVFDVEYNPYLIQEIVRMQMANSRRGTHKTKQRSEIKGSTKKLYRQKGTGRARAGTIKSPVRRGGGIVFGPTPRDYSFHPPKKARKKALKIALSRKLRDGNLEVLREFDVPEPKTKPILAGLDPDKKRVSTLIIMGEPQGNLRKSLNNVPFFKVLRSDGLNLYDVVKFERVILLEKSVPMITERLSNEKSV